jgi:hypothetical protein
MRTYRGTGRDPSACECLDVRSILIDRARNNKIFDAAGCEEERDKLFCRGEGCNDTAKTRRMLTTESPAKYLVGFVFCAVILQAQEPTPSPTPSRVPLRPHHDDSRMPEDAQQPQNVPELLPKSDALPGTGARLLDLSPNAGATPIPISPEEQKRNEARFAEIRSSATRAARPIFLLEQSRSALTDEARKNYLRAYYYSVCAEMRRMEPSLKSMINAFEREQIHSLAKGRSPLVTAAHRSKPSTRKKQ